LARVFVVRAIDFTKTVTIIEGFAFRPYWNVYGVLATVLPSFGQNRCRVICGKANSMRNNGIFDGYIF
jgi:hypothetical protein